MGEAAVQYGRLGDIRPTGVKILAILNIRVVCSWFYFPPNPTQALADQGGTKGSGNGK